MRNAGRKIADTGGLASGTIRHPYGFLRTVSVLRTPMSSAVSVLRMPRSWPRPGGGGSGTPPLQAPRQGGTEGGPQGRWKSGAKAGLPHLHTGPLWRVRCQRRVSPAWPRPVRMGVELWTPLHRPPHPLSDRLCSVSAGVLCAGVGGTPGGSQGVGQLKGQGHAGGRGHCPSGAPEDKVRATLDGLRGSQPLSFTIVSIGPQRNGGIGPRTACDICHLTPPGLLLLCSLFIPLLLPPHPLRSEELIKLCLPESFLY